MTEISSWFAPMVLAQAGETGGNVTGVLGAEGGSETIGAPGGDGSATAAPTPSPFGGGFMMIMLPLLVFMVLMTMMSGRKDRKKRAAMLGSIAKHDRVQTSGGIVGTIVELRDSEMVLKVDEGSNTKITFARSAVSAVLHKGGAGGSGVEEVAA